MKQQADLGNGSIGRLLFQMAIPTIIAQVVNALYNIVDRIYIGHIPEVGATALTGVGLTFPLIMIISAFSMLIGMGGAPRVAFKLGEQDQKGAEEIVGNCTASLAVVAVILTVVTLVFAKPLLLAFGGNADTTLPYAVQYINIYAFGTIFVQFVLGLNPFITAQGFSMTSMKTILIGAVTNIVLDPVFIFVFGMGVRGAALATILSQCLSAVWVLRFLTGKTTTLRIQKKHLRFNPKVMLPVLALGMSPFIMQITESALSISFNTSLYRYGGDLAVGAMTIASSVMQFALMPLNGLTQGAQPIISFNFGAGNTKRVKAAFRLLLISCVAFSTLMWSVAMFAPQVYVGLFSSDPMLTQIGVWAIRISMAACLLFGIQIACQQTFIALNEATISIFLAILRKVILLIPLIFILPHIIPESALAWMIPDSIRQLLQGYDIPKVCAVYLAEPVADFLAVVTTAAMFAVNFKKILSSGPKGA